MHIRQNIKIEQITRISDIRFHEFRGYWVFFDIDDTLLTTVADRDNSHATLIEPKTTATIRLLQDRGIPVFALTARHKNHIAITLQQLASVGINFKLTERYGIKTNILFSNSSYQYHDGVLFAETQNEELQKANVLYEFLRGQTLPPPGIIVVDDLEKQLESILNHNMWQQLYSRHPEPLKLFHFAPPSYLIRGFPDQNLKFPENLALLQFRGERLSGASGGVIVLYDTQNNKFTLKAATSINQIKEEIAADAIYRASGINVPDFAVYTEIPLTLADECNLPRKGIFRLADFMQQTLGGESQAKNIVNGFAVDAWLRNVDVAKADNLILNNAGVWRVDNGCTLLYHACGESKFLEFIASEVDTLRPRTDFYRGVTDGDIGAQVHNLLTRWPKTSIKIWELQQKLDFANGEEFITLCYERLRYLADRFCPATLTLANKYEPAIADITSASVLVYTKIGDKIHVLLGKRRGHAWWGNLGGKSDPGDKFLADTAAREVYEESMQYFNFSPLQLNNTASHDLITYNNGQQHLKHRMYIAYYPWIAPVTLTSALLKQTDTHRQEYTEFRWQPLDSILQAFTCPIYVMQENNNTLQIAPGICLHPPLYNMLRQEVVQTKLKQLNVQAKSLAPQHTRSVFGISAAALPIQITRAFSNEPQAISATVAAAVMSHAGVMQQLKQRDFQTNMSPKVFDVDSIQSMLYLRIILGKNYIPGKVADNIELFFATYHKGTEVSANITNTFISVIENERANADKIVLYHACMGEVATLFDFFTIFRKKLHYIGSENCQVLRLFDSNFAKYKDVHAFIENFNKDGPIDNYDEDYQEMGLSTNLFLFGNNGRLSSATYWYFISNHSVQPPKIETFLTYFFSSILPHNFAERFQWICDNFAKDSEARLYQIFIDPDMADEMVYAAKDGGQLKELQINGQSTYSVTSILQAIRANPNTHAEYIQNLQARLFLKPELMLDPSKVKTFDYHAKHFSEQHQYQQALGNLADELIYNFLLHNPRLPDDSLTLRSPLRDHYEQALSKNGITPPQTIPEYILVNYLQKGDLNSALQYLSEHPETKIDKLPNPNYMHNSDFWTSAADIVDVKHELLRLYLFAFHLGCSLPKDKDKNESKTTNICTIIEDRIKALASSNSEQLSNLISNNDLILMLFYLLPNDKKSWFFDLLELLGPELVRTKVSHIFYIDSILYDLPEDKRTWFLKFLGQNFVRNQIRSANNPQYITRILSNLPENERAWFLEFLGQDLIKDVIGSVYYELRDILKILPEDKLIWFLEFLGKDFIRGESNPVSILKTLPEAKRIEFLEFLGQDFVKGELCDAYYELKSILKTLPKDKFIWFLAFLGKDFIRVELDLASILGILPEAKRIEFLEFLGQDFVQDVIGHEYYKLNFILKTLPEDKFTWFLEFLGKDFIRDESKLVSILKTLPENKVIEFLEFLRTKSVLKMSHYPSFLRKVLLELLQKDQEKYFLEFLGKDFSEDHISTLYCLQVALEELYPHHRCVFIRELGSKFIKSIITTLLELESILEILQDNDTTWFLEFCGESIVMNKISSKDDLCFILTKLSETKRAGILGLRGKVFVQSKVPTLLELISILSELPEDKATWFLEFLGKDFVQSKIPTLLDLQSILKDLPEDKTISFLKFLGKAFVRYDIRSVSELITILKVLPEDKIIWFLEFLGKEHVKKFAISGALDELKSQLPESKSSKVEAFVQSTCYIL